jgi:hypothetical protein
MSDIPLFGQIWPLGYQKYRKGRGYQESLLNGEYIFNGKELNIVTDAAPVDPDFASVSLLLSMDGSDGGTTFVDSSSFARTVFRSGSVQTSTVQSKFGGASALFDGSGDYLSFNPTPELEFTADFTIECFAYPTVTTDKIIAGDGAASAQNVQLFRINNGGTGNLAFYLNGTQVFGNTAAGITANQWQHLAISRTGSTTRMFVNGTQIGSSNLSWTGSFRFNLIGGMFGLDFQGYIDEFRVTKGVGRYTANFTPPTEPFPIAPEPEPEPEPEPQLQPPPIVLSQISYSQSSVYPGTTAITNSIMTNGSITDTGAATNNGVFEFIKMDLGYTFAVGSVVIGTATSSIPGGWSKSYTQGKIVSYSIDDSNWITAFNTGTFATDGIYTFDAGFNARYIRIESNGWLAVSEFYALSPEPEPEPPSGSDPDFSSVSLLLHMDGINGLTTFTDSSSNALTVTANGSAQISTAEAKWGTGALRTTRSVGQLTLPSTALLELTGDFTIEFWVYAVQDRGRLVGLGGTNARFEINQNTTAEVGGNAYKIYINNAGVELFDNVAIGLVNQAWRHVALTRSGNDLRLFGGGTLYGTRTHSSTFTVSSVAGQSSNLDYFDGFIDEFRVTKGIARYTANFTPPTAPFPNS